MFMFMWVTVSVSFHIPICGHNVEYIVAVDAMAT